MARNSMASFRRIEGCLEVADNLDQMNPLIEFYKNEKQGLFRALTEAASSSVRRFGYRGQVGKADLTIEEVDHPPRARSTDAPIP